MPPASSTSETANKSVTGTEQEGHTMIATDSDKPGIEERFLAAANTSDMTVDVARASAGDLVMAAGFSKSRLGSAMIHLQSEWDRCSKPPKKTAAEIAVRALALTDKRGRPDVRRATVEALVWHATALREVASKLSGRSVVIGILTEWATPRGIDLDLISPAVFHWLAPKCGACDGLGVQKFKDAPSLTDRKCRHCEGAGTWPRPLGAQAIHDEIKSAIGRARAGTAAAYFGG